MQIGGDPTAKSKTMEESLNVNGIDSRSNESLAQTNAMLRQKLDEEHANYKRKLQAYQDGQQRQAQLIQKLQSKVSVQIIKRVLNFNSFLLLPSYWTIFLAL